MQKTTKPPASNQDDNIDDLGRDIRTGKTREEQHPQQTLEIGKQKPKSETEDRPKPEDWPTR